MAANDPIAYWNGAAGERWTREQEALDRAFVPLTPMLFAAAKIAPGERVLDVGCGCGTTSLAAAEAVGASGAVLGVDVSAPMLGRAIERSAGSTSVGFHLGDAAVVSFDPVFDVMISRFGVMFFREPERAFANLRSALAPRGRLAFLCWRPLAENEWARIPYEVARQHVPAEAPSDPEAPGPFSFGDPGRVRRVLGSAGFAAIGLEAADADVVVSSDGVETAVDFAMTAGPTASLMRDASDDAKARVRAALSSVLAPVTRGQRTALGGAVWIVTATR